MERTRFGSIEKEQSQNYLDNSIIETNQSHSRFADYEDHENDSREVAKIAVNYSLLNELTNVRIEDKSYNPPTPNSFDNLPDTSIKKDLSEPKSIDDFEYTVICFLKEDKIIKEVRLPKR